jgi:hypothetical protein
MHGQGGIRKMVGRKPLKEGTLKREDTRVVEIGLD